jgi:hypothetical protein
VSPGSKGPIEVPDDELSVDISQIIHVRFGRSYVTIDSKVAQVTRWLVSSVEPMLTLAPSGDRVGSFVVTEDRGSLVVRGSDPPSSEYFREPEAAARALYHRLVKTFIDARPDLLWIHAGVVSFEGRAIALSAPSGQGKSTMVAELLNRGWTYLSDEIAPIDPVAATVLPFPLSPYKRISADQCLAGEGVQLLNKVRVELEQAHISPVAVTLGRVYFLCYSPQDSATRVLDCSPGAAVVELLRNSLNPSEARHEEIQHLCQLMSQVRTAYLHYSHAAEAANQIVLARRAPDRTAV